MKNPFKKTRVYGFDRTIHQTEGVDVEVDRHGQVVAVWFRCQALPFKQSAPDDNRADSMRAMYARNDLPDLVAVELQDADDNR